MNFKKRVLMAVCVAVLTIAISQERIFAEDNSSRQELFEFSVTVTATIRNREAPFWNEGGTQSKTYTIVLSSFDQRRAEQEAESQFRACSHDVKV